MFTVSAQPSYSAFQQGVYHYDMGNVNKARQSFQKTKEQDPRHAMANVYRALVSPSPEDFSLYLQKAKENLETANEFEKLYYTYAETFLKDDWETRLATAQKMVAQYPDKARAYLLLGDTYNQADEPEKARSNYQKAIEMEPAWAAPYMQLTFSYLLRNPTDIKQAEKNAKKLVSIAPEGSTYVMLGDVYRAQNDFTKAIEVYSKGIQMDAALPQLYIKRGHAYTFSGNFDKARADYQQAGTIDDVPINAHSYYATTFVYQGMPEKAVQTLLNDAETITTNMKAPQAMVVKDNFYYQAAFICMHTGDVQQLKEIIARYKPVSLAVSNQTGTAEAKLQSKADMLFWEGIVKTLEKDFTGTQKNADEMKVLLEPIKNPRKLAPSIFLRGYTSLHQKDYAQAIAHFEKISKEDRYAMYWMAKAYEGQGNTAKAKALYKDLAAFNFNDIGNALIRNEVRKKL